MIDHAHTYSNATSNTVKPLTLADMAPLLEQTRKIIEQRRMAEAALDHILRLNPIPIDALTAAIRAVGPVTVHAEPHIEAGSAYYVPREETPWGARTGGYIAASEEWLIGFEYDLWMARLDRELRGGP